MIENIRRYLRDHQLVILIVAAVAIALVTTVLSVVIYVRSGAVLLDLSRPGYEPVREQIKSNGDLPRFEVNGTMSMEQVEEFRALYKGQVEDTAQYGDFSPKAVSDKQLYLE